MQVHIGATVFDTQRRPLVIALLHDDTERQGAGIVTTAKEAAGHGADLVAIDASLVTEGLPRACARVGVGCVGVARSSTDVATLRAREVAAIDWRGSGPVPHVAETDRLWTMARSTGPRGSDPASRSPDAVVVGLDAVAALDRVPTGVVGLVDLSTVIDRAATAALVTIALSRGASGFITTLPSAVRRAAHVIRAVEHAE